MLSAIMLSVIMLSVVFLSAIMLIVVFLSVVAPQQLLNTILNWKIMRCELVFLLLANLS